MEKRLPLRSVLRPIRGLRVGAFALQVISIALSLVQPLLIGALLDRINAATYGAAFAPIKRIAGVLVVASLLDFGIYYLKDFYFSKVLASATSLMRENTLSAVLKQPTTLFQQKEKGDVLNRILNDSDLYAQYIVSERPQFLIIFLRVAAICMILMGMSPPLTITVACLFILYLLMYLYINRRLRPRIQLEREQYSNVMSRTQETLDGFSPIKNNVQDSFFARRFSDALQRYLHAKIDMQRYASLGNGLINAFYVIIPIAVLTIGAYWVVNGQITLGTVIAFYSYTHWIIEPVYSLGDLNRLRQQAMAALPRLIDLEINPDLQKNKPSAPVINHLKMEHVCFSYGETPLLCDLSLCLERGQRVAVTGESGVGKTSLAELLLGLIAPSSGEVKVNEIPLQDLDERSYLTQCAYLPQSVFLFSGNLPENISFQEKSNVWLEEIIQLSYLDGVAGRNGLVIEGLSGGERQRIGLARALYRRPSILICDEPTSALDENMERLVIQSLDHYLNTHPCIFIGITHRKALLEICDMVLKLEGDGKYQLIPLSNRRGIAGK